MHVVIRPETAPDIDAIAAVTAAAFRAAAHASHTEHFIVAALRNGGALALSLVADMEGRVVGHVAASPVVLSDGGRGWFGLGPLSVHPAFQRRGIGKALMHAALDVLRECGAAGCVLLGDPVYYRRFGFAARPELVLPDVPPAYFQALSFDGSRPAATVSYHAAFAATE